MEGSKSPEGYLGEMDREIPAHTLMNVQAHMHAHVSMVTDLYTCMCVNAHFCMYTLYPLRLVPGDQSLTCLSLACKTVQCLHVPFAPTNTQGAM